MQRHRSILILKLGSFKEYAYSSATGGVDIGDYEHWFVRGGLGNNIHVVDPRIEPLPNPDACVKQFAGVVITGSPAMVTERLSWSESTAEWLRAMHNMSFPILGVCYGHQLLAHAFGGVVDWNPKGTQLGSKTLSTSSHCRHDALFGNNVLSDRDIVQVSHSQIVTIPPCNNAATVLAWCDTDDAAVLHYSNQTWSTQFHPEFTVAITQAHMMARAEQWRQRGRDPDMMIKSVLPSTTGMKVLTRFKQICEAQDAKL